MVWNTIRWSELPRDLGFGWGGNCSLPCVTCCRQIWWVRQFCRSLEKLPSVFFWRFNGAQWCIMWAREVMECWSTFTNLSLRFTQNLKKDWSHQGLLTQWPDLEDCGQQGIKELHEIAVGWQQPSLHPVVYFTENTPSVVLLKSASVSSVDSIQHSNFCHLVLFNQMASESVSLFDWTHSVSSQQTTLSVKKPPSFHPKDDSWFCVLIPSDWVFKPSKAAFFSAWARWRSSLRVCKCCF